jgi:hypothetical protein
MIIEKIGNSEMGETHLFSTIKTRPQIKHHQHTTTGIPHSPNQFKSLVSLFLSFIILVFDLQYHMETYAHDR